MVSKSNIKQLLMDVLMLQKHFKEFLTVQCSKLDKTLWLLSLLCSRCLAHFRKLIYSQWGQQRWSTRTPYWQTKWSSFTTTCNRGKCKHLECVSSAVLDSFWNEHTPLCRIGSLYRLLQVQGDFEASVKDMLEGLDGLWARLEVLHTGVTLTKHWGPGHKDVASAQTDLEVRRSTDLSAVLGSGLLCCMSSCFQFLFGTWWLHPSYRRLWVWFVMFLSCAWPRPCTQLWATTGTGFRAVRIIWRTARNSCR